MKPRALTLALALAVLVLGSAGASSQTIGVFFDVGANSCSGIVAPFSLSTLYVLALPAGPAAGGITGAAFRIDGAPAGWFYTQNYPGVCDLTCPAPLVEDAWFAFPTCQTASIVPLMSINVLATGSLQDVVLTTRRNDAPNVWALDCPVLVLCDAPTYTGVCASGNVAVINPVQETCTLDLAPSTWSKVKSLYGD